MGGLSLWHWIIVLIVVLLLFGRGRVSDIMGEFGKGLKSFKQGVADETNDHPASPPPSQIAPPSPPPPPADSVTIDSESKVESGQSQPK